MDLTQINEVRGEFMLWFEKNKCEQQKENTTVIKRYVWLRTGGHCNSIWFQTDVTVDDSYGKHQHTSKAVHPILS